MKVMVKIHLQSVKAEKVLGLNELYCKCRQERNPVVKSGHGYLFWLVHMEPVPVF